MQQVQASELRTFLATHAGALLLDVREFWEVERARIDLPGATTVHIPMQELPGRLNELGREQPVVCICHHGARSAQVVAFLQRQGYRLVYNLAGGVDAWSVQVDASVPRY
jgi:rhodanese-related sulfurtransferase